MEHLTQYIPIVLILSFAGGFALVSAILGNIIGPKRPNPSKELPYESGMAPMGEANVRIPVKFYKVALTFLLFDIEAVFILTWALIFRGNGLDFESGALGFTQAQFTRFAFFEMFLFVVILMIGFAYEWGKGGLEWS